MPAAASGLPRSVLLVLSVSDGGVGHHVRALEEHLLGGGVDVRVACPLATQRVFGFRRHLPVELGATRRPRDAARALLALRAQRPEVVHAHGLRAGALSALARREPLVVTWHNAQLAGSGPTRLLAPALERLAARRADVTLAASEDLAARARAAGGRDVRLVHVPAPQRTASGADPGLGHPLVLSVGRLAPQKGYEVLLAALPAFPDAVVAVAGDGPLRERYERLAPQVRWLGRRTDVADLYAAADVVVLPSLWEARSLTAQEALRAGAPLVATAVGGLPGLLQDGALLVPPGDPVALGAAVRSLLEDPARSRRLAQRGREVAQAWPDERTVWQEVAAAYDAARHSFGRSRHGLPRRGPPPG